MGRRIIRLCVRSCYWFFPILNNTNFIWSLFWHSRPLGLFRKNVLFEERIVHFDKRFILYFLKIRLWCSIGDIHHSTCCLWNHRPHFLLLPVIKLHFNLISPIVILPRHPSDSKPSKIRWGGHRPREVPINRNDLLTFCFLDPISNRFQLLIISPYPLIPNPIIFICWFVGLWQMVIPRRWYSRWYFLHLSSRSTGHTGISKRYTILANLWLFRALAGLWWGAVSAACRGPSWEFVKYIIVWEKRIIHKQ